MSSDFSKIQSKIEKKDHPFWEIIKFAIISLLIVLPIRFFIIQPFIVSGESMFPTFKDGDYLIVDELSYLLFKKPERGEVIVFKYPLDKKKFFIKRIIALPNESIKIENNKVYVKKDQNWITLDEDYLRNGLYFLKDMAELKLKDNEYFVLGDNRNVSSDSRVWGPVEKKLIVGRVLVRLFPFNEISFMPGDYQFSY